MNFIEALFVSLAAIVVGILVFALVVALPTMYLWNWLMPDLFGLTQITFFQAFGLLALASLLFKPTANGGDNK